MPRLPTPPLSRYELLIAAGLCLLLAAAQMVPRIALCGFGGGGGESPECQDQRMAPLLFWLGRAVWMWSLWLVANLTHPLLPRADQHRPLALAVQILALTLLCPLIGAALGQTDDGLLPSHPYELQIYATFTLVACLTVEYRWRRRRGEADADSLAGHAPALAHQLDQARAALLQAQVEPHFLFNTLAHLRRLAVTDPTAARAMLADLRHYLDAALPELRQPTASLARELDLVRAFLALHQRCIGPERLRLAFDIAPGLGEAIVPSTCLLTLAENAIKHGITPEVDGGEIRILAAPDAEAPGQLLLEVADTGAGMGAGSGGGTGLATLRARLASLHGSQARLSLHLNQPRGLIARVQLPWTS